MKINKVVFVLNSIQQQRCIKRIEEFIENGYEVKVYGFDRDNGGVITRPTNFEINIIGNISNNDSFIKRLAFMSKALKKVISSEKGDCVLFYYFLLDVAIAASIVSTQPYIYENSDLMYGYFTKPLQWIFKQLDKAIINRSEVSILTSQGFIDYLFKGKTRSNVFVIPNKINKRILGLDYKGKIVDINHLSFSFVGFVRQPAVLTFAEVIANKFPQHEFRIYGPLRNNYEYEKLAEKYGNIKIMGKFTNPDDLPSIYQNTDIIVSALGNCESNNANIIYAEANKIYEAIYFRKPIVVGTGTYQANKVKENNWGFNLASFSFHDIEEFINSLTLKQIEDKIDSIKNTPMEYAVDNNTELFEYLKQPKNKSNNSFGE